MTGSWPVGLSVYAMLALQNAHVFECINYQLSKTSSSDLPVANNGQTVRTVLLAKARQVRVIPTLANNGIKPASLAVLGSLGHRDITDNAP